MTATGESRVPKVVSGRAASADWRWWHILAVDIRSLALFRVVFGACLLIDLLGHLPEVNDFYTDAGILPRDALTGQFGNPWGVSLHLMSGQYIVQLAILLVAIVLALGFLAGYRTRLCTIGSWVLLCSMQVRNPVILHGGDDIERLLLFWCMFLPLNARFSLDRALNPTVPLAKPLYLSAGSLGLLFQMCFLYWFAAISKWHPIWIGEGSAIYYALSLAQFATPFGTWLLQFPRLLRLMTYGTLALELGGPLLVFCPFLGGAVRLGVVLAFVGFHTGLGLTLRLGSFPWVCASGWLALLPPLVWEVLARRRPAIEAGRGVIVFFDATCGFCRRMVPIVRSLLRLSGAEMREAQSDAQIAALMQDRNAWVVRDPAGGLHSGYDGLLELCRRSPVTRPAISLLASAPVRGLGERAYRWVASNRAQAGRFLESLTPPAPRDYPGFIGDTLALASLGFVLFWNVSTLQTGRPSTLWRALGTLTQLNQQWRLFAPYPTQDGGWYVIEGVRMDGTRFDLWNGGGTPTDVRPADPSATYRNAQWRKYLGNIWMRDFSNHRPYFGRYLCRKWNGDHVGGERVNLIYISMMFEPTPPPGTPRPPATKELVWRHYCFDKPPDW
jgi:predicted DCC family thiol-disulfide oxidoreductase YuxK